MSDDRRISECSGAAGQPNGVHKVWGCSKCNPIEVEDPAAARRAEWVEVMRAEYDRRGEMLTSLEGKLHKVVRERESLRAELDEVTGVSGTLRRQEVNRLAADNARLRKDHARLRAIVDRVNDVLADPFSDDESELYRQLRNAVEEDQT